MKRTALILFACLLPLLMGCGHQESARAGVHLGIALDAITAAPTLEQAKAIATAAKPVAAALVERESVGGGVPITLATYRDWLDATSASTDEAARKGLADRILGEQREIIGDLASHRDTDQVVATGGNLLWSLLGLTGAGGAVLAIASKTLGTIKTLRSTAQAAFDGFHQAQTALRQVSPEAAAAIDSASVHLQERLGPAVVKLGDVLAGQARVSAAVVPLALPVPAVGALDQQGGPDVAVATIPAPAATPAAIAPVPAA